MPMSMAIPLDRALQLAFEELNFFSREVRMLGTYLAHPFRTGASQTDDD